MVVVVKVELEVVVVVVVLVESGRRGGGRFYVFYVQKWLGA